MDSVRVSVWGNGLKGLSISSVTKIQNLPVASRSLSQAPKYDMLALHMVQPLTDWSEQGLLYQKTSKPNTPEIGTTLRKCLVNMHLNTAAAIALAAGECQ